MVTSPKGYPFEHIVYDAGQLSSLHDRLGDAHESTTTMRIVLGNVTDHLEGSGQALTRAKGIAAEVSAALTTPASRIASLRRIVRQYGDGAETHGGRANRLMAAVTDAQAALSAAESDLGAARDDLAGWTRGREYAEWRAGDAPAARSGTTARRDARYRDAVDDAAGARDRAVEDLATAWADWEHSFELWDDAYADAVAALARLDGDYSHGGWTAPLADLADADTPAEVAAIWNALDEKERTRLLEHCPKFIGNLEGVPYEYRIAANVAVLEEADKTEWGEPTDTEVDRLLYELRYRGGLPVSLNLFDKNQATAAMLYVNGVTYVPGELTDPLSGVTNVNVLIGGMLSELRHVADWGQSAIDLNSAIDQMADRSATMVWFGYDTPNYATVGSMAQAEAGAETLTNALRGLDLQAPPSATTTVIGHSYGSTTAFLAVGSASDDLGVDRLIAIGSAGLGDQALGDDSDRGLDFTGTEVFASTSPEDNWARKGRWFFSDHPIDPGSLPDATSFDSNGGYAPNADGTEPSESRHDGEELLATPGHGTHDEGDFAIGTTGHPGGYLQEGSESFANIANIAVHGEPLTSSGGYGSDDWWLW